MSQFLYYVPGFTSQTITPADVIKSGLSYAFPNGVPAISNAMPGNGPDGGAGAIWTDDEHYRYVASEQTWGQSMGVWVGFNTASPPGPDDLIRPKPLDGSLLEMGDEREWLVPVARRWSAQDSQLVWQQALPSRLTFKPGNQVFIGSVLPRYARLWAICEADSRVGTSRELKEDRELLGDMNFVFAAIYVLQANYRISAPEVELLGLFTQETPRAILDLFGDWENYRALDLATQKKTPDSPPSSSGQEVMPLNTDQP